MTTVFALEPRSQEPTRKAIGSQLMKTRLPDQEEVCEVIIELCIALLSTLPAYTATLK
jgi:hypothetical protein